MSSRSPRFGRLGRMISIGKMLLRIHKYNELKIMSMHLIRTRQREAPNHTSAHHTFPRSSITRYRQNLLRLLRHGVDAHDLYTTYSSLTMPKLLSLIRKGSIGTRELKPLTDLDQAAAVCAMILYAKPVAQPEI